MAARNNGQGAAADPPGPGVAPGAPALPWVALPPFSHVLQGYAVVIAMYVREQEARREQPAARHWLPRLRQVPGSEVACIQAYRLDPGGVEEVCQLLGPQLQPRAGAGRSIPVLQKVLMGLHYLATGSFQTDVAHRHGTSQSSASRCLHGFLAAMMEHIAEYIVFPTDEAARRPVREMFYTIAGFPNVISAVDATHVAIVPPHDAPGIYRNRHRQYSMNVQACCDAQGLFTSVCARFPGSVHDAQVFDSSGAWRIVSSWPEGTGWLLGDRGYPLRPYLLTPYPVDTPGRRARYNVAHRRTRIVIERAFGQLKMRFRCLHLTGGRMMRTPEVVADTFLACAMLHNVCVRRRTPLPDAEHGQGPLPAAPGPAEPCRGRQDPRGVALRERVAAQYFV